METKITKNADFKKVLSIINKINNEKDSTIIIGIDGPCGSGKTTIAKELADLFNASVIHMDHFFLPPELRTQERLLKVGGNIHFERFYDEIVTKIKSNKIFNYRVFDCKTMNYSSTVNIYPTQIIIIEGVYSMLPLYQNIYDIKFFCNISKDEQKKRIIARNGIDAYKDFETKWIPMEENYFKTFEIQKECINFTLPSL